jgi:hypothetical protein
VYPYLSGFLPKEIAAEHSEPHRFDLVQGQQCENCHGPGSTHVDIFEKWNKDQKSVSPAELARGRSLVKRAKTEDLCIRCHDYENSPNFKFSEYWEKVNHTGLRN